VIAITWGVYPFNVIDTVFLHPLSEILTTPESPFFSLDRPRQAPLLDLACIAYAFENA
jgi:hypothetical protein